MWREEQRGQLGQMGFAMVVESNAGVAKATAVASQIKEQFQRSTSEVVHPAVISKYPNKSMPKHTPEKILIRDMPGWQSR